MTQTLIPSKKTLLLTFGVFGLWVFIGVSGLRLPFLRTDFAFFVRFYWMLPALILSLIYLAFIFRPGGQAATLYEIRMSPMSSRKARIYETLWIGLGLILIPGTVAWTAISFPAWATQLLAYERSERAYIVLDVTRRGGAESGAMFEISLRDSSTDDIVDLPLTRSKFDRSHWQVGRPICLAVRTWSLGTVVDGIVSSNKLEAGAMLCSENN